MDYFAVLLLHFFSKRAVICVQFVSKNVSFVIIYCRIIKTTDYLQAMCLENNSSKLTLQNRNGHIFVVVWRRRKTIEFFLRKIAVNIVKKVLTISVN